MLKLNSNLYLKIQKNPSIKFQFQLKIMIIFLRNQETIINHYLHQLIF